MLRSIRGIFPASTVNMGGVYLEQALPNHNIDQIDPFLLIHHWDKPLKGKQSQKDVGVGPHPHRGFSPVTVILKGTVHGKSPLLVFIIEANAGGKSSIHIPDNFNGILYQANGRLLVNNSFSLGAKQLAWFKDNGDEISIESIDSSQAVLLAGEPTGEEVTSSGPFVMNSHTEILEAMRDYQMGKMGILVEEFD